MITLCQIIKVWKITHGNKQKQNAHCCSVFLVVQNAAISPKLPNQHLLDKNKQPALCNCNSAIVSLTYIILSLFSNLTLSLTSLSPSRLSHNLSLSHRCHTRSILFRITGTLSHCYAFALLYVQSSYLLNQKILVPYWLITSYVTPITHSDWLITWCVHSAVCRVTPAPGAKNNQTPATTKSPTSV